MSYFKTEKIQRTLLSSRAGKATKARRGELQEEIHSLQRLLMELQQRLDSIGNVGVPEIDEGLDFYAEVRSFEIELIRKALTMVGGHQGKAARLLKLNPQTLNMKIKRYQLRVKYF